MPFTNAVMAGKQIVRNVMQSANFVANVAGWAIFRNGNAQFNNVTLTGTFSGTSYLMNASGAFFYDGTPGPGNLIAAIVSPGVTTDPFGNPTNAVLNIGNFSAGHIGFDDNGNTYVSDPNGKTRVVITGGAGGIWAGAPDPAVLFYNSFGAVILVVDPQAGGTFQYQDTGSAVQGVLIGSQCSKLTTDPINGGAVPAGIFINDPVFSDTLAIIGANINWGLAAFSKDASDTINQGAGSTSPYRHIAAPEQTSAGHIVQRWYGTSVDGTVPPGTVISATDPPVRATKEMLELQGSAVLTTLKAFAPASTSTEETWHALGLASGWSNVSGEPVYSYRLLPDGNVQITGSATHTSITANTQLGAAALPAAYRPATTQYIAPAQAGQCGLQITTAGIVNAVPPGSGSGTARCNGTYPLNL